MHRTKILIVDDNRIFVEYLLAALDGEGWALFSALSAEEALAFVGKTLPDIIILDVMMPVIDGIELCRRLKKFCSVPIIMLSGKTDYKDKVECLTIGAEDYITKPFAIAELIARIKVILKRNYSKASETSLFAYDGLKVDFSEKRVTVNDKEVELTPTEYKLLREFIANEGKVLDHQYLLNAIWGTGYGKESQYLHAYVSRLRSKLKSDPQKPKYIKSVPGMGYLFKTQS